MRHGYFQREIVLFVRYVTRPNSDFAALPLREWGAKNQKNLIAEAIALVPFGPWRGHMQQGNGGKAALAPDAKIFWFFFFKKNMSLK